MERIRDERVERRQCLSGHVDASAEVLGHLGPAIGFCAGEVEPILDERFGRLGAESLGVPNTFADGKRKRRQRFIDARSP